jgi:hypothetical protein
VTREKWLDPSNWASLKPFGIGEEHPNNYLELWEAFRENRDQARYAWRILSQGTCDGCALGTKGMRDWTTRQVHLCNVRLRLLRLNTMPALDVTLLADVAPLAGRRSAELRGLGRLPYPMVRRRGRAGLHPDRLGRRPRPGRRTDPGQLPRTAGCLSHQPGHAE